MVSRQRIIKPLSLAKMKQEVQRAETELVDTGPLLLKPTTSSNVEIESPSKKRACEETSLPLSNKKTREVDSADAVPACEHGIGADSITNPSDTDAAVGRNHGTDANDKRSAWPMRSIETGQITNNDLLIGVGRNLYNTHPGNVKFRELLKSKNPLYQATKRGEKKLVVTDIIREWRSQDPPGRFLSCDKNKWLGMDDVGDMHDVGDEAAAGKIRQNILRRARERKKWDSSKSDGTVVSITYEDKPNVEKKTERVEVPVHTKVKNSNKNCAPSHGNEGIAGHNKKEANQKYSTAAPQNEVSVNEKETIQPHNHGSMYNDVLSFFVSTPFNANSMWTLHEQKELGIMSKSLIHPPRASLPILPQKQFMSGKPQAPYAANNDETSPKSSPTAVREVQAAEETKNLANMALPTSKDLPQSSLQGTCSSTTGQPLPHSSVAAIGYADSRNDRRVGGAPAAQELRPRDQPGAHRGVEGSVPTAPEAPRARPGRGQGQGPAHAPALPRGHALRPALHGHGAGRADPPLQGRAQAHPGGPDRHVPFPLPRGADGRGSQPREGLGVPPHEPVEHVQRHQEPAAASPPLPPQGARACHEQHPFGTFVPVSKPVSSANGQHPIAQGVHGTQFIRIAILPDDSACGVSCRDNSSVMAAYQVRVANPQPVSKMATTSRGINESVANVQTAAAKTPPGFGLRPNDINASKHSAQAAAENQIAEGRKIAKSKGIIARASVDGKHAGFARSTPPKAPETLCRTPKAPRTPADLLSTKPAPNLPTGWISKTFIRTSGKTAGTRDTYFYSPQQKIKFRSIKGCNNFLQILSEPRIDGKECTALKVYKEMGHKF